MAKLWEKGYALDEVVERFTVGRDYQLDRALVTSDAMASIAHVRMLARVGFVSEEECRRITLELRRIAGEGQAGTFVISPEDEDCHTAIESRLVAALGDSGKKVHTGRSRNDQVTVATRLYTREGLLNVAGGVEGLISSLIRRAGQERETVMAGRTHLQVAMLSTFGLWLASWAEQLTDDLELIATVARLNDRSPLGSAASYGTPLPLDREYVANELGFEGIQNNVLSVQHSRGTLDARIVEALSAVATTLGRMAQDLILFALPELGYVRLPLAFCSGSSIMPQKRNPDLLELLRAKASVVDGWATQCRGVARGLFSGYNRDLQESKEPLLRALTTVGESLTVATQVVERLEIDRERMRASLGAEVFATDYAYQLVEEGTPFREAYRRAAEEYHTIAQPNADDALSRRRSTGTPGNLNLSACTARVEGVMEGFREQRTRHVCAVRRTLGEDAPVELFRGDFLR